MNSGGRWERKKREMINKQASSAAQQGGEVEKEKTGRKKREAQDSSCHAGSPGIQKQGKDCEMVGIGCEPKD